MTADYENLNSYLKRNGWERESEGSRGSIWARGESVLRVPSGVDRSSFEWDGLVRRIADALEAEFSTISSDLTNWYVDVTEVRGVGDIGDFSIALDKGVALVEAARVILRTSATTSRGIRPQLGYQYSKVGDRLVERARMGHTKSGSFIIPILMPVEPDDPGVSTLPPPDGFEDVYTVMSLNMLEAAPEPDARRATRTMAEALSALQRHVVDAAREPTDAVVSELVVAGVARETVSAVRNVLSKNMTLRVGFDWAEGVPGGRHLPKVAKFPQEADDLLALTERKLRSSKRPVAEPMTGHIVAMRAEPTGWIRLATVRAGRACEVEIDINGPTLERAHEWFATRESLRVEGKIERRPGRPLRVPRPDLVYPTSETQLPLDGRGAAS